MRRPIDARKKTLTSLEQACEQASAKAKSGKLRCQAVKLYQGGQYFLYKYKRYDGPAAGVRAGDRHCRIRGRSGQFSVSALVAGFLDAARL